LGIGYFFNNTESYLPAFLTLTYVPHYFDILPMYLGILALMPLVVAIGRLDPRLAMDFVATTWLAANLGYLDMPASPTTDRAWFFNPFAWQLIFFTGFFVGLGWIKPPKPTRVLIVTCIAILVVTVPFAWYRARNFLDFLPLAEIWKDLAPLRGKTDFGILRYLHFLALAYLAWIAAGEQGHRLMAVQRLRPLVDVVRKVGQQSLAVFLLSMFLARVAGMVLDAIGRSHLTWALVNLTGFVILALAAYAVAWVKSVPWQQKKPQPAQRL